MGKPILYIDMDEVLCDFYNHPTMSFKKPYDRYVINGSMTLEEFWIALPPLEGAIEAVHKILEVDSFSTYILTQPVKGIPESYSGKAKWVREYLPELNDRLIMTQNKGLLIGNYLVDDNLKNKHGFNGRFIHFDRNIPSKDMWKEVLDELLQGEIYE